MSEILKALQQLPPEKQKIYRVTIEGKQHVVTRKKKIEIKKHGEDKFMFKDGLFILKPKPKPTVTYPVLKKSKTGYVFHRGDIHWPTGFEKGGEEWLIEQE